MYLSSQRQWEAEIGMVMVHTDLGKMQDTVFKITRPNLSTDKIINYNHNYK
jgi:hypothetical protein